MIKIVMLMFATVGCAAESAPGLELATATPSEGLSGIYRDDGAAVRFETVRDADGALAARFFDESGWSLVERQTGATDVFAAALPSETQVASGAADHRRARELIPAAAAELAAAELTGLDDERAALVELAVPPTAERVAQPAATRSSVLIASTTMRCSRSKHEWAQVEVENDSGISRNRDLYFNFKRSDGSYYHHTKSTSIPAFSIVVRQDHAPFQVDMYSVTINGLGVAMYAWLDWNYCLAGG